jgi:Outer membrane protein beta-barrel domain
MMNKNIDLLLCAALFFCQSFCHAQSLQPHFYIGGLGGYGSTTWDGLVPSEENQNLAITISTPIRVREGGSVWGLFTGIEFSPYFAIEANYTHYPKATVTFDKTSLFCLDNNGLDHFSTKTETISLMGKVMLQIPRTKLRLYSSIGAARLHRQDMLMHDKLLSPTFGAGLNYSIADHWMGELAGNYIAGFGEPRLQPTDSYFPFLYSVTLRLAYLF